MHDECSELSAGDVLHPGPQPKRASKETAARRIHIMQ